MKKLNLTLGGIKEMLTKEQMKQIIGGYTSVTCYWTESADCTNNGQPHKHYFMVGATGMQSGELIDLCMTDVDIFCARAGDCCDGDGN